MAALYHIRRRAYGGGRAAVELWLVYVLERLIALFGMVFIRYFLTP